MWFSSSRRGPGLNCPNFSAKFCMAVLSVLTSNFAELHAGKRRRLAGPADFSRQGDVRGEEHFRAGVKMRRAAMMTLRLPQRRRLGEREIHE